MMLEPRRPSSVHSPFGKATLAFSSTESGQLVEVKKSTILCGGPQFIQDFKQLAHGQFEVGWLAQIMIIMEMNMMKYTTSSLGLYCSLNLFDPSAAAEETSPKIIQNSSSKFSK